MDATPIIIAVIGGLLGGGAVVSEYVRRRVPSRDREEDKASDNFKATLDYIQREQQRISDQWKQTHDAQRQDIERLSIGMLECRKEREECQQLKMQLSLELLQTKARVVRLEKATTTLTGQSPQ